MRIVIHSLAALALVCSGGEPLPRYTPEDSYGYARLWCGVNVFGETTYRLIIQWTYFAFRWDGRGFEFVGVD